VARTGVFSCGERSLPGERKPRGTNRVARTEVGTENCTIGEKVEGIEGIIQIKKKKQRQIKGFSTRTERF